MQNKLSYKTNDRIRYKVTSTDLASLIRKSFL